MEKIDSILPVVMEIVVSFPSESFITIQVESTKVVEIGNLIRNSVKEYIETKVVKFVQINGLFGPADFRSDLVFGMYVRPAHLKTTESFQKKIIELTERQVEASEKMVDDSGKGEQWKE